MIMHIPELIWGWISHEEWYEQSALMPTECSLLKRFPGCFQSVEDKSNY